MSNWSAQMSPEKMNSAFKKQHYKLFWWSETRKTIQGFLIIMYIGWQNVSQMLTNLLIIAIQWMQKNPEISRQCYRQPIQECRAGMIKVFVFLRKPATSHPFLSLTPPGEMSAPSSSQRIQQHLDLGNLPRKWNPVLRRGVAVPEMWDLLVCEKFQCTGAVWHQKERIRDIVSPPSTGARSRAPVPGRTAWQRDTPGFPSTASHCPGLRPAAHTALLAPHVLVS